MESMKLAFLVLLVYSTEQQEVILNPVGVLASAQGGEARITCFSSATITEVEWTVNDTAIQNQNLTNVSTEFVSGSISQTGVLTFSNLQLEYNATRISCTVITASGRLSANEHVLLLVQGPLSAVGSLMMSADNFSVIYLSWTAPFTLDISDIEPDVTYCVDAVNSTSAKTLFSECEINKTEFAYPIPPSVGCGGVLFTVTPVNVVGNGTEQNISFLIQDRPDVVKWTLTAALKLSLAMSSPVCSGEVTFVDVNTENTIVGSNYGTIAVTNMTFNVEQLRQNRIYNVSVIATNLVGSTAYNFTISTHDIRNATFHIIDDLEISLKIDYFDHSIASGALLVFVPLTASGAMDSSFLSDSGDLINCNFPVLDKKVAIECQYSDNSLATAFQVIAQCSDCSQVNRLYVNQSLSHHTSTSIQVEENGLYQVTVFPIRGDKGIVGSNVEHSQQLNIQDVTAKTEAATDIETNANDVNKQLEIFSGSLTGALFVMLIGASIIITLLVVSFKRHHSKLETMESSTDAVLKNQVFCHTSNSDIQPENSKVVLSGSMDAPHADISTEANGSTLQLQVPIYSCVDKRKKKGFSTERNETSADESECQEVVYANVDGSNQGSLRKSSTVSDGNKRDKSVLVYEVVVPRNCARVDTFQTCSDVNQVVYAELLGNK